MFIPDVWKYNRIILYFNKATVLQFTVGHLQLLLSQYAQLDLPEMYWDVVWRGVLDMKDGKNCSLFL